MATTVRNAADLALGLLGKVNQQGKPDANRESKYYGMSVALCNRLQNDILQHEGFDFDTETFPALSKLDDDLTVSDKDAVSVLSVGLAAEFARIDGDSQEYNVLAVQYSNAIARLSTDGIDITDYYNMSGDTDLTGAQ